MTCEDVWFLKKYITSNAIPNAHENPKAGDTTKKVRVFSIPGATKAEVPPATKPDPISPPINA
ncbi:MAG: hypothetical protein WCE93_08550 [Nitrososphaeraceae archaeon]